MTATHGAPRHDQEPARNFTVDVHDRGGKRRRGRPRACVGATADRVLWLIRKGDMRIAEAARVVGMSERSVYREATRNPEFRERLTAASHGRLTFRLPRRAA